MAMLLRKLPLTKRVFVISLSFLSPVEASHAESEKRCYYSKAGVTLEIPIENGGSCQDVNAFLDELSSLGEDVIGAGIDRSIDPREERLKDRATAIRKREELINRRSLEPVQASSLRTRRLNPRNALRLGLKGLRSPMIILELSPEYKRMEKDAIDDMLDVLFPGLF